MNGQVIKLDQRRPSIDPVPRFNPEADLARQWFQSWVEYHGLKRSKVRHECPHGVVDHYCGRATNYVKAYRWCSDNMPPFNDHPSLWNRDGRPVVYVYHPYLALTSANLAKIETYAADMGMTVNVTEHSWYFPGGTVQVELWRDEAELRLHSA